MRRCELAGARRDLLDLHAGTFAIEVTRVVVNGKVIESDGKTENAQHLLPLDPFTLAVLKSHLETLDRERGEFEPDYQDHGLLFCWENGRPPHPDTIRRRFKKDLNLRPLGYEDRRAQFNLVPQSPGAGDTLTAAAGVPGGTRRPATRTAAAR